MKDSFGRTIDYMRISITDRCNLRCRYCMPDGVEWLPMADILTYEELLRVCRAGARLGIRHIKITGGEPLVRKGCCSLIGSIREIPGIEAVTITTNGILLSRYLTELKEAGGGGINLRPCTVGRQRDQGIPRFYGLGPGVSRGRGGPAAGLEGEVHALSLAGDTPRDGAYTWEPVAELARSLPVDVRFIEMMPIGYGKQFETVDHEELKRQMKQVYPGMEKGHSSHGYGPAVYYRIPGFMGGIGLISAIHGKFCSDCNRIRLTSTGYMKTRLCYEDGVDLREVLRGNDPEADERLVETMRAAVGQKPMAHCFEEPERITEGHNMISIGG